MGYPISDDDLVYAALNGLDSEYDSIISAVSATQCHGPLPFSALRTLLQSHESLLLSKASSTSSAFYVGKSNKSGSNNGFRPNNYNRSNNSNHAESAQFGPNFISGSISNNSNSVLEPKIVYQNSNNRLICQLCKRLVTSVGFIRKDMTRTPNGNLLIKACSRPIPHILILQVKMNMSKFWIRVLQIM
jgi:hypothetical protein